MFKKMKVSTKRVLSVLALMIVVFGVYTLGMSAGEKKEESKVVNEQPVTAESGVESDSSDVQVDVEPSPEQVEAAEAENEASDDSDEYSDDSDPTPTQKYFSLMRNVFIKYEDKLGTVIEMHSADDDTITIETDRADFVIDLVVSEGYAYITNMDTAEKNRYPLPEE